MEKTIVIKSDGKETEIRLKATMEALQIHRTEFGEDLIHALREAEKNLHPDPFADAMIRANINPTGMSTEELQNKIFENIDFSNMMTEDDIPDEEAHTKVMQIVWAMAKAADPGITAFKIWIRRFDALPVRAIADRVQEIWQEANRTTVELKN